MTTQAQSNACCDTQPTLKLTGDPPGFTYAGAPFNPGDVVIDTVALVDGNPPEITFKFENDTSSSDVVTAGIQSLPAGESLSMTPQGTWRFAIQGVCVTLQNTPSGTPPADPVAALTYRDGVLYNGDNAIPVTPHGTTHPLITCNGFTLTSDIALNIQGDGTVEAAGVLELDVRPPSETFSMYFAAKVLGSSELHDPTFTVKSVPPKTSPCNCE